MQIDSNITCLQERYLQGHIRAVIWDMDGVLADTMPAHIQALDGILRRHGARIPDNFLAWCSGRRDKEIVEYVLNQDGIEYTPEDVESLIAEKVALFNDIVTEDIRPIPGVGDWLAWLNAREVPCAVASSSMMGVIVPVLQALHMSGYFQALVSGVGLPNSKPHPDIFLAAAAAVGVPPQDCLVVEDSLVGIEAARRAGMACLGLATTFPAESLSADLVLRDLSALPPQAIFS